MNPDTTYCLVVQKRSTIKIVPEDIIVITGSKKNILVHVETSSLPCSLDEWESAADKPSPVESDESATKSEVEIDPETSDCHAVIGSHGRPRRDPSDFSFHSDGLQKHEDKLNDKDRTLVHLDALFKSQSSVAEMHVIDVR
jgi:hypothetical protein